MIDSSRVDLVVQFSLLVAGEEDDGFSRQLGPIHLVKYLYLADLSYAKRNNGQSFTGIDWQFYNFGPWSAAAHARIEPALNAVHASKFEFQSDYGDKNEWVRWSLHDSRLLDEKRRALPATITRNLTSYVHKFGKDTPSLLDFVYKTKPMLSAAPNEYLDLSLEVESNLATEVAKPSLRMEDLSNKKKKELQQKMAALRELHKQRKSDAPKLINPVPNPRFDAVYHDGVTWLESLSGEQLNPGEVTVEFSTDVWKSTTRKGEDVP
ncbi:SocA family protein [Methylococcaceae bacterium WWC4]|nr:SocA family protein [Methylococcaceae bacterium WWC4]